MSTSREKMSSAEAFEICQEAFMEPRLKPGLDPKKNPIVKAYKNLSSEDRQKLSRLAATRIDELYVEGARIDTLLYLFTICATQERDWDSARAFLDDVLAVNRDTSLFRELAISLLEFADMEINEPSSKLPLAETALVLLTEFGLLLADQKGKSSLDPKATSGVVEFISTSLVARSNVNNTAMRISLIHFLSRCESNKQASLQLNRVIGRFGHSLLEDLLRAFFEDKKKVTAAFFFLVEHLYAFFAASPALAGMCHDVLKHHMLKYPAEFPSFLASYSDWAPKDEASMTLATRHLTLLYRAAVEVYQRPLAEGLGRVLYRHLRNFESLSKETLAEQIELIYAILRSGPTFRGPRLMLVQDFSLSLQALGGDARAAQRVISLSRAKRSRDLQVKLAKVGEKPSPLESMLQLAG